jgi:hypothetical protein
MKISITRIIVAIIIIIIIVPVLFSLYGAVRIKISKNYLIKDITNSNGDKIVADIEKYKTENGNYPDNLQEMKSSNLSSLIKKCYFGQCIKAGYYTNKEGSYFLNFGVEFGGFPCDTSLVVSKGRPGIRECSAMGCEEKGDHINNDWYYYETQACM